MDEKKQSNEKTKNCGMQEMPEELQDFSKICDSRCTICQSPILKELHEWKRNGMNFSEMVKKADVEFSQSVSASSLCRHFQQYNKFKLKMAAQIIKDDTIGEITAQSVHIRKTVELLDLAYDNILNRMKANNYNVDISDLEKLAKMRYQILSGENLDDKNVLAIFQKASNEYGLELQQGVLFKS